MPNDTLVKLDQPNDIFQALVAQTITPQNTPFQSVDWFKNSLNQKNVSFLTEDAKQGKITMHLQCAKQFGLKIKEFAGEPYIQYNDVWRDGEQPVETFLSNSLASLKRDGVVALYLHNVREDAHIFEYCKKNGVITDKKQAPRLNLGDYSDFDAYLSSMSKTTRKKFRRIHDKFECEFKKYSGDQLTKERVAEVINLKQDQLNQNGLSSRIFVDSQKVQQLIDLLSTPSNDYKTIISVLKCNGKIAAGSVSFVKDNIFYAYMIGLNADFSKDSPGNHLMLLNIKAAFSEGLNYFDLLSPASTYKFRWTKGNATNSCDFLLPLNMVAKLYAVIYLKHVRKWAKKLYFTIKAIF